MEDLLKDAVESIRADYVDIRVEKTQETRVHYKGKQLEHIEENNILGGHIRVLHQGAWGFAAFSGLSDLKSKVNAALDCTRVLESGKTALAEVPVYEDRVPARLKKDPRTIDIDEKHELCKHYNEILLENPEIKPLNVLYQDKCVEKFFASSEGTYLEQEQVPVTFLVELVARDSGQVQMSRDAVGSTDGFQVVEHLDQRVFETAQQAIQQLKAPPIHEGIYDIIMDPILCGQMVHEAFGHMSEADFYGDQAIKDQMHLKRQFGPAFLDVIDDATLQGAYGAYAYDDEGVPGQKTYVLKGGVLAGHLHSRETAKTLGERPTGNARALDYRFEPIVRMSCTYITPGTWTLEEMMEDIKTGIYAKSAIGGTTNMNRYVFHVGEAHLIDHGERGRDVKNVMFSGDIFTTLGMIDAVGSDLKFGAGGCAKKGQQPLPISAGGPHIRMRNVHVRGG